MTPTFPRFRVGRDVFYRDERWLESLTLTDEILAQADCVVIIAGHRVVDYAQVVQHARLVVDAVNATQGLDGPARVVRLGAPLSDRASP